MSSKIIEGVYELREEIGRGGGGIVYLAWHLRLDKPVVLKADKYGLSDNLERLRRESNMLKGLSHTYIPIVYDFLVDEGNVYTVMDYIEGESLDKPLNRGEHFSQSMVIRWMKQLLEALSYMHNRPPYGILHGDIKPANIMLTPNGDICLIDFNIALALGAEGAEAAGASGGYASPEQYGLESLSEATGRTLESISNARTILMTSDGPTVPKTFKRNNIKLMDVRSDIYSLGATIYHILSGVRPALKAKEVVPLSSKKFSAGLVTILTKAMNPDPDLRYQTADEMLNAVNRLHVDDPRFRQYRRTKFLISTMLTGIFLTSGFCAFTGLKRIEQTKNALVQAEYSTKALSEGNVEEAIRYAMEASESEGFFVPTPPPQAQKALADALGVYDLANGYQALGLLKLPSPPLKISLSPDGKTIAAVCAYEVILADSKTAQITARLPAEESALIEAEFLHSTILIYAGKDGVCAYDTEKEGILWQGNPATAIALSADGQTIATVDGDADEAILYTPDGKEKTRISFSGKKQKVPTDDSFGDPCDSLFALNKYGSLLAVSFADGSLDIFSVETGEKIGIQQASKNTHFEGGFNGIYFAFSACDPDGNSVFAVVDTKEMVQTGGFQSEHPFLAVVDEDGVYLSSDNLIVELDPETGDQKEVAYMQGDIIAYAHGNQDFIATTENNCFYLFDGNANLIGECQTEYPCNFVRTSEGIAVAGGRSSPDVRILKRKEFQLKDVITYDANYFHDEARIHEKIGNMLLYSYQGFRLYNLNGKLIREISIPDAHLVTDQQYSPKSGNLAVMYPDALRIYSGFTGSLLFEETGLQSVIYAPYGVSILRDGTIRLIDIDDAKSVTEAPVQGEDAAVQGMVADRISFGTKEEIIGATKREKGFLFAVQEGNNGRICNEKGKTLFSFEAEGRCEAFFTEDTVFLSPQHGTPVAYHLRNGRKIRTLQPDSFLAYVTKVKKNTICEYVTASGDRFGVLLDEHLETIARFPGLTDIAGDYLFFDYKSGYIRKTNLIPFDELIQFAADKRDEHHVIGN